MDSKSSAVAEESTSSTGSMPKTLRMALEEYSKKWMSQPNSRR